MPKKIKTYLSSARDQLFQTSKSLGNESMQRNLLPYILFLSTVSFYVIYQLLMQPSWVLGGEMWAEMATNYFSNANSTSYLRKFFSTDSGYLPIPQRIIAFFGNQFNLPAASVPYFYTWSAIICTGLMIGAFCLKPFRTLVKSDSLRFLTGISILMVADFETRTFINFTYFSAFFVAIVSALALIDESEEVPRWAWFIPILMFSKPAVLAVLPAMILIAMVSKSRFRWITLVVVALSMAQLLQMVISAKAGVMPFRANEITIVSKITTSFIYFFGFLGDYVIGHAFNTIKYFSILCGLLVFCICIIVIFFKKNSSGALILTGLSLLFFNVLLNSFALSDSWNLDLTRLDDISVSRHLIVGFIGCILVVCGLSSAMTEQNIFEPFGFFRINLGPMLFLGWFMVSGWLTYTGIASREPSSPRTNNSYWQSMSKVIDSDLPVFCVPIDPFSWQGGIYGRNCALLNPSMNSGQEYRRLNEVNGTYSLDFTPPSWLYADYVISIGILVKPAISNNTLIVATAKLSADNNLHLDMFGQRELPVTGGLLMLSGVSGSKIKGVKAIKIDFNFPVDVKYINEQFNVSPAILWMGQRVSNAAKIYEGKIVYQSPNNRGKADGLFLVKDGFRHWIANAEWIASHGFNQNDIIQIDSSEFISIYEDPESIKN